jgi:allantoate deiminase
MILDVRHGRDEIRSNVVNELMSQAHEIARRRGLTVAVKENLDQCAVSMHAFLVEEIERAISKTGCTPHRMVSGAGHDAMIIAEKIPAAMVFLRTPGGISHHPSESAAVEDVEKAIECGMHLLDQLASSRMVLDHPHHASTLQERNLRA